MKNITQKLRLLLGLILALSLVLGACQRATPAPVEPTRAPAQTPAALENTQAASAITPAAPENTQAAPAATQEASEPPAPQAAALPVFAAFEEQAVQGQPSIQHEPVAPDLSNVTNPFVLSAEQIQRLGQDGIVVTPGQDKEFYTLYETARYQNLPVFVTSDSLLHSYHLIFDKVLRTAERQHFIPLLQNLNASLLAQVNAQYQQLKDTAWEDAARRSVAFVGVASRLLDPSVSAPAYAEELVNAELALVESAGGILPSPLFPYYDFGEDYTQYIPRGHYTLGEDLKAYFKSMMWYGRMTFRLRTLDPEAGRAETRSALLLATALRDSQVDGRPALDAWADLYSPTAFFVGRSDDLTIVQYLDVIDQVYGESAGASQVANDSKLDAFIELADQLPPPRILGMVISAQDPEVQVTKGMRFMGQRFVPDAYIFRQLIYRNVGSADNRRGLPKGLDLMAAMGSERAYALLEEMGETDYANYPQQMEKMQSWLSGLTSQEWTETLYNAWLYSFTPLLAVPAESGYPQFMQTTAWLDKQLNTSLGSWAELKHDTILYAKQAYAEMGGGPPAPDPLPAQGYVEPIPEFYARLAALIRMSISGLGERGLLEERDQVSLERMLELTDAFKLMAEKELTGQPLTAEEQDMIRFYGGDLEHFVMSSADSDAEEGPGFGQFFMEEDPQAAVIADVATDPDGNFDGVPNPVVLEEAVGRINAIHVVVPVVQPDGAVQLQVVKGGVFSYYEFSWPAEDRLTDEKWRTMLADGSAPAMPEWTGSFMVQAGEYADVTRGVNNFQETVTNLYWDYYWWLPEDAGMPEGYEAYAWLEPELRALKAAEQHIGHQLVGYTVRSVDVQDETLAVVTVEETWQDQLLPGGYPDFDQQPISVRAPYTVQVTYTLELVGEPENWIRWAVTEARYEGAPPEWQHAP